MAYYVPNRDTFKVVLKRSSGLKYDFSLLDYFVLYIFEYDSIYIVPSNFLKNKISINLFPHRKKRKRSAPNNLGNYDLNNYLNNFNLTNFKRRGSFVIIKRIKQNSTKKNK